MNTSPEVSTIPVRPVASGTPGARGRPARLSENWAYLLIFAAGVVSLGLFLGLHLSNLYRGETAYWRARQSSVADDRVQRIAGWLKELEGNAKLLATRPTVRAALQARLESDRRLPQPGLSRDLGLVLDETARIYGYAGAYILDRNAQVLAQSSNSPPLDPLLADIGKVVAHGGSRRIDVLGNAPANTLITFCVPILPASGTAGVSASTPQLLGVGVLVMDASKDLFPTLTRDAVPTRTGETLLVWRDGNDIIFFSPLRFVPEGSRNLRFSLPNAPLPARAAVEGHEVPLESTDYRGVPVLADSRRIPMTGWGLVRKIDRAEALENLWHTARIEALAGALLLAALGGLLVAHRRYALTNVLKAEAEKFRGLLESAPDAMVIVNPQAHIVVVNAQAEKLFGFARQDMLGQSLMMLVPERLRAERTEFYAHCFSDPAPRRARMEQERWGLRKDGSEFPAQATLSPIDTPQGPVMAIAFRDITERKRAEQSLKDSEEQIHLLLDSAAEGIYGLDQDGKVTLCNRSCLELLGYQHPSDLLGKPIHVLCHHAHPDGTPYPIESCRARSVMDTGDGAHVDDEIYWRSDGTSFPAEYWSYPIRKEGKLVGCVVTFLDISLRRQAEKDLRMLNQELELRVRQRTAELEAANKELEAFTYSVSHDLRAPLRHIDGFSKILMEEDSAGLTEDSKRHLARIREGTKQMGQLVDDLLNLARLGRKEVALQVTGLSSLVQEVMEEINRENSARSIEWKIGTLPFVDCDPGLIKQVFVNLLSNAAKYTRPRQHALIEVGTMSDNGQSVVFVRDNGVGFSMKYADKLFGVFQRLHRAEDFEGTGIGLATVQSILRKHGGRVWAEAELDKGATFYFTLGAGEGQMRNERVKTTDAELKVG